MQKIYIFFIKTFLCCILFLVVAITCKGNYKWKNFVHDNVYKENFSFSNFKNLYNNYLGGIFPIDFFSDSSSVNSVFHEELVYGKIESYEEGAVLEVNLQYLVPALEDGIVVYIGEKDKYNQVVIVENQDGVDFWYGNLCNIGVKLYDTIQSGTYLGEVCDDKLYLVFSKGNQYLKYDDYLG